MEMTRGQLNLVYLMLNRDVITKRELLNLNHKGRTIQSLVQKGLLAFTSTSEGESLTVVPKTHAFAAQIRVLENRYPNVNREGYGTYLIRLSKMVDLDHVQV